MIVVVMMENGDVTMKDKEKQGQAAGRRIISVALRHYRANPIPTST